MEYLDKLVALGLNVAYYRKLRLMTQEQLAEKAKISVSTIRKLENPSCFFQKGSCFIRDHYIRINENICGT